MFMRRATDLFTHETLVCGKTCGPSDDLAEPQDSAKHYWERLTEISIIIQKLSRHEFTGFEGLRSYMCIGKIISWHTQRLNFLCN